MGSAASSRSKKKLKPVTTELVHLESPPPEESKDTGGKTSCAPNTTDTKMHNVSVLTSPKPRKNKDNGRSKEGGRASVSNVDRRISGAGHPMSTTSHRTNIQHRAFDRDEFWKAARDTMIKVGVFSTVALRTELEQIISATNDASERIYWKKCQKELHEITALERECYTYKHLRRSELFQICNSLKTLNTSEVKNGLILEQIVIIGNRRWPKAFELTVDMYRMARFITETYVNEMNVPQPTMETLFVPSPIQIINSLSNAVNALSKLGVVFLYISADNGPQPALTPEQYLYDTSGLLPSSRMDVYHSLDVYLQKAECLHPGDLMPFMRRPLFIIIDSTGAVNFKNIKNTFGTPLVIVMAPATKIFYLEHVEEFGLLTFFLTKPIDALFFLTDTPRHFIDITTLYLHLKIQKMMEKFTQNALLLFEKLYSLPDLNMAGFIKDTALQSFLVNYIFCRVAFNLHAKSRDNPNKMPTSIPPMHDISGDKILHLIMWDIVKELGIHMYFIKPNLGENSEILPSKEQLLI